MRCPLVPSPPDVDAIKEGMDFSVGGHGFALREQDFLRRQAS